ncbi:alpha/beta-hydrolase [Trametes maxima]|nr:alpha/beta-hydrolase [Trametes maxima]
MAFFRYRYQPFQSFYFLFFAFYLLLVKVPYWAVRYALPSKRPQPWSLGRVILVKCYRTFITGLFQTSVASMCYDPVVVEKSGKGDELGLVWVEPSPELVVGEIAEAARANDIKAERTAGYWLGKRGSDGRPGQPAGPDEKVIYGFHGGGYVMGSAHPHFATGYIYRNLLDKYAKGYDRIFQVEYRLSQSDPLPPQGAFPAALIDALAGYKYLVHDLGFKPSNILVMGESAGANLALQLTRYLSQNDLPGLGRVRPRAQLLLSPVSDWGATQQGPGTSWEYNYNCDMVHDFFSGYPAKSLIGNLSPETAWENSWLSPGSLRLPNPEGTFKDLPPTCIIIGGAEMMLDPVKTVRDRIATDIGEENVTFFEIPHGAHVPMTHTWHEPESRLGYEATAKWVESLK